MNNEEGNKLIAIFDGWKYIEDGNIFYKPPNWLFSNELKYHSSWDWLMPVVEKVEEIYDCPIEIFSNHCRIIKPIQGQIRGETKIEATWLAAVEFIKWYNHNKLK